VRLIFAGWMMLPCWVEVDGVESSDGIGAEPHAGRVGCVELDQAVDITGYHGERSTPQASKWAIQRSSAAGSATAKVTGS
jgi:hypothetical protein